MGCCSCIRKLSIASRCVIIFEASLTKTLLIIAIASIVYSDNWLPVLINFAFLFLVVGSVVCYSIGINKIQPVLILPLVIMETVTIFWMCIWIYASITSIKTGYLWSLEWVGGPRASREPTSNNVRDANYVDPNKTSPENKKSITFGVVITVLSIVIIILKIFAWRVARRMYFEVKRRKLESLEGDDSIEKASDLGAESPPYPQITKTPEPIRRVITPEVVETEYGFRKDLRKDFRKDKSQLGEAEPFVVMRPERTVDVSPLQRESRI